MSRARIVFTMLVCLGMLTTSPATGLITQAAPNALSLTVSPSSVAPGNATLAQGAGFTVGGSLTLYWETLQSGPVLGGGTVSTDGTFAAPVTIPPGATPGKHVVWAESIVPRVSQTISATVTVLSPNRRAVYVHAGNTDAAKDFKNLLDANGIATTLLHRDSINDTTDFRPYDLIVIGPDTGDLSTWGSPTAVTRLRRSGKPTLGVGDGGYAFFGKLGLLIGYGNGGHSSLSNFYAVNRHDPVYRSPYPVSLLDGVIGEVYSSAVNAVEIYLPRPDSNVYLFGRDMQLPEYYQEGFPSGPGRHRI